jgi:hypothetical protein
MKEEIKYRFYVTTQAGQVEMFPQNTQNLNITWAKDQNSAFFRKQLTGKVKFVAADFDYLFAQEHSIYRCTAMPLLIDKNCDGYSEFFLGRMLCDDGTWDLDHCEVEIQANPADVYQCYDDNKSTTSNLFDICAHDEHVNTVKGTIETVVYTDNAYPPTDWKGSGDPVAQGWTILSKTATQTPSAMPPTINQTVTWIRETLISDHVLSDPWILQSTDTSNPLITFYHYARPPALFDRVSSTTQDSETEYTSSYAYKYGAQFQNGMKLYDVMNALLQAMCPGLTLKSDFFQWNPDVSTTNYATGEDSKVLNLILFQKSDVKRPPSVSDIANGFAADDAATDATTDFDDRLSDLCNTFQLQFWIDEGNNFRIEHPSWFNKVLGLDLTLVREDAKFRTGLKSYSYNTDGLPHKQIFTWMDVSPFGGDFAGMDIVYQSTCSGISDKNNKNINVQNTTTDVELCLDNPEADSSVSDDGFVLMACDGDNFLIYQSPILTGSSTLNNTLSWAALQFDYWRYNNYFDKFILNNNLETTQKLIPNKKQSNVIAVICCGEEFDADKLVKTGIGTGIVNSAVLNLFTDQLTLELLFEQNQGLTSNNPPIAINGNERVAKNGNITIDVLARASDSDGTIVDSTLTVVSPPIHGTAVVTGDFKILYTPTAGYIGPDSFTWTVEDDFGQPSNTATENITVFQPAVAVDDEFRLAKNRSLNRNIYNLLTNDMGVAPLTAIAETKATTNGNVVIRADGSFDYTPNINYIGDDTFDYTLKDVNNDTDVGTVTIHVFDPVTVYAKLIKGADEVSDVVDICFRPPPGVSGPTHVGAQTTNSFSVNFYSDVAGTIPLDTTGYEAIVHVNIHKVDNSTPSDSSNDANYMSGNSIPLPDYVTSYTDNGCDGTLNHHYTQTLSLIASPDYTII